MYSFSINLQYFEGNFFARKWPIKSLLRSFSDENIFFNSNVHIYLELYMAIGDSARSACV